MGDPFNMGIDGDRLLAEGVPQDNICGLPAYPRKGGELFQGPGNLAFEFFRDPITAIDDAFGLIAIKARGTNFFFQSWKVN
jgi:hypothetical protein